MDLHHIVIQTSVRWNSQINTHNHYIVSPQGSITDWQLIIDKLCCFVFRIQFIYSVKSWFNSHREWQQEAMEELWAPLEEGSPDGLS